jgi:hypothetical protein
LDQSVTSALNIKNEWSNKLDREENGKEMEIYIQ